MKTKNHGFTLVELMVAIVISLVAVLAATEVYVSTRQTNRLQGMQSRLSEDGRFAVSMLQRFLSQAGFRPTPSIALPDSDSPDGPPIAVASNVIRLRFVPDGANQIACDGSALRDAGGAFQAFEIGLPPLPQLGDRLQCRSLAAGAAAVNWIVPAARAPGAAAGAAGNGTEVKDFKVWFGVDTNITPANIPADFGCGAETAVGRPRDCIADTYVRNLSELITPATPTSATPDQIKTVRVCLVLRSEASDGSVVRPTPYKDCGDVDITESQTDRKLYRTFVTTVLMKNLKDR
jgi:type IV pilus assembly protein PilW